MVVVNMKRSHTSGFFRSAYLAAAILLREQLIVSPLSDVEVAVQMIFTKLLMPCPILAGRTHFALADKLALRRGVGIKILAHHRMPVLAKLARTYARSSMWTNYSFALWRM